MNHDPSASFVLSSRGGEPPPLLERVDIEGRIDGLLFTSTVRQTWRHRGERPLEAIYSFPLSPQALLLEFASVRGDERLEGTIALRAQAERTYELALSRGDAPMLLEVGVNGLHTASLGNLLPGETLVTEVRFVQLVRFENGRLRLQVPTTIAPRYGQPGATGPAHHQLPVSAWSAEYPLSVGLTIAGALASARLECPTHPHRVTRGPGQARFELEAGARLDRDVVVLLHPAEPRPALLVTAADPIAEGARQVALAAFELPRRPSNRPLSLKLLIDCSGSMAGDSMDSARAALHGIADRLGPQDEVALMRFGEFPEVGLMPALCSPGTLHALRAEIDATTASLGGTDMQRGLHHTLAMRHRHEQADVLVITDGQVWTTGAISESARKSGQRIFAIGVGSAPAEGLLRELTSASGGACEFTTPGEDLQAASLRMIERMRDTPWHDLRVEWSHAPDWQPPVEATIFGGDTLVAMAVFDRPVPTLCAALRLVGSGQPIVPAASEAVDSEVLARLVADRRWPTQEPPEAAATSLRYRLLNTHTHSVLVHGREDRDRMKSEAAELVRVPQMLAAGWGGTGQVGSSGSAGVADIPLMVFRSVPPEPDEAVLRQWRSATRALSADAEERNALALTLPEGVWRDTFLRPLGEPLPEPLRDLMTGLAALGMAERQAWQLIAWWLMPDVPLSCKPVFLDMPDAAVAAKAEHLVQQAIAAFSEWTIANGRTQRLRRQVRS